MTRIANRRRVVIIGDSPSVDRPIAGKKRAVAAIRMIDPGMVLQQLRIRPTGAAPNGDAT